MIEGNEVDGASPSNSRSEPQSDSPSDNPAEPSSDGRSLRRARNVERAIDAVIDLASEGAVDPSWEEISERANVSHRSLYRYFSDRSTLLRAAVERMRVRITPLLDIGDVGEGQLDDRIARFVTARLATYRGFGPIARTAFREANETEIREGIDSSRQTLRKQLVEHFAPELVTMNHRERTQMIALLDLAFQFEALEYLSQGMGLDDDDVEAVLVRHLSSHLEPLASP